MGGGDLASVVHISRVILEADLVFVPALVPPFLYMCLVAAVGLLLGDIAPAALGW